MCRVLCPAYPAGMDHGGTAVDVSVILPVHNENGHLQDELKRIAYALDRSEFSYEIVVVDDGSTDGSTEALRSMDDIRVIHLARNRGAGFARRAGTTVARGDVIVWTDVDMTYPNERIPELVRELEGHDQVVGARTSEQGTVKFLRVPAKWFIRKMAEYLSGETIPDLNSGMRVFRADVLRQFLPLLPKGFSHVTTVTMAFLGNDYDIKYVPIEYSEREGRSKFHWWSDTQRYVLQVTRMVMMHRPLKVFMPLGFVLLATGLGKLIFDVVDKDFRIGTNTIVLLVAAAAMFIVGLLADLIVQQGKLAITVPPAAFRPIEGRAWRTRARADG